MKNKLIVLLSIIIIIASISEITDFRDAYAESKIRIPRLTKSLAKNSKAAKYFIKRQILRISLSLNSKIKHEIIDDINKREVTSIDERVNSDCKKWIVVKECPIEPNRPIRPGFCLPEETYDKLICEKESP